MPAPIPTAYYNQVGDAEFRKKPIAAGPWKFVSQTLNSDVKYERFDDYWDASRKPNFKKLTFQIVPDESSRVAGVKTGDLDIAFGLTAAAADAVRGRRRVQDHRDQGHRPRLPDGDRQRVPRRGVAAQEPRRAQGADDGHRP